MQSAVLPADGGPGPGWGLAPQQAPQARPPSVPPCAAAEPPPPSSPATAVADCEVQPRPSSMQDVQALLHDLMHRQEQQQATLPGGRVLAVPAASATASPSKEDEDSPALAHTAQAATPRSVSAGAQAAVRADVGTAASGQPGDKGQQEPVSSAAPPSQQAHEQAQAQQQAAPGTVQPSAGAAAATTTWPTAVPAPVLPQPPGLPGVSSATPASAAAPASVPCANGMHAAVSGAGTSVSVPLLSSAIAAMLAGSMPLQQLPGSSDPSASQPPASTAAPAATAPAPAPAPAPAAPALPAWGGPSAEALLEQLSRVQQQMAAQATEQQRQLSYVQSMHHWASQVATSLRQLQKQGRSAASSANAAQEEAAAAKASLVQLATLQDSSMQQVCQLSLEVAELKEQMQLVLMESGRGNGGGKPRRRGPTAAAAQAQAQQAQAAQQQAQQQQAQAQHLQQQQAQQQQMQVHHQQQAAAQLHMQLQMQAHAQQQAAQQAQQDAGLQPRSPKRMKVMPRAGMVGEGSGQGMPHGMVAQPGAFYHLPYPAPLHVPGDGSFAACALFGPSK